MEITDPYGFIYITTNLINGKRYIGQKKFDNKYKWKSYIGSGFHFLKAVKKYGKENFIRNIIDIAHSPEELNDKEKSWIENYNAVESDDFYNMIEGGNLGNHLKRHSIPVVCIDNNLVFKSIADASMWSGYTNKKIKRSFDKIHTYDNFEDEDFIFRLLFEKNKNKRHCIICGKVQPDNRQKCKMCEKCHDEYIKVIKLKKCKDCKMRFKSNSNRQVRCEDCQTKRNKETGKLRQRTYRKKEIIGGVE